MTDQASHDGHDLTSTVSKNSSKIRCSVCGQEFEERLPQSKRGRRHKPTHGAACRTIPDLVGRHCLCSNHALHFMHCLGTLSSPNPLPLAFSPFTYSPDHQVLQIKRWYFAWSRYPDT